MNAKQRKQAERLKRDMEFTLPLKVQELHRDQEALKKERGELYDWFEGAKKEIGEMQQAASKNIEEAHMKSNERLEQTREELKDLEKAVLHQQKVVIKRGKEAEAGLAKLKCSGAQLIADVLLQLELDAEPAQIAHNLRVSFGLAIPEW